MHLEKEQMNKNEHSAGQQDPQKPWRIIKICDKIDWEGPTHVHYQIDKYVQYQVHVEWLEMVAFLPLHK